MSNLKTPTPPDPGGKWARQKDARAYCFALLAEFDLVAWDVIIDTRPKMRMGQARQRLLHGVITKQEIGLTQRFVWTGAWDDIIDVVRHEVAHAIAGLKNGHNRKWRQACAQTGARPVRCQDLDKAFTEYKWHGTCTEGCVHDTKKSWVRHKMSRRLRFGARCPVCKEKITWKENFKVDRRYL